MSDYFTKASGAPRNIHNYNNVYYSVGDKGWDLTGQTFDYNAYYGGNTLVQADAHKITDDPKFVDPGSGGNGMDTVNGYQLQATSPLIGAGIRINDNGGRDYFGNLLYNGAPDIGAHEYEGSVPPAGNMPDPIVIVPKRPASTPVDNLATQAVQVRHFKRHLQDRLNTLLIMITTRHGKPRPSLHFRTISRSILASKRLWPIN